MTDTLILIRSSRFLKYTKTMDMVLGININFKIVFLNFSNVCCRNTLELPLYNLYRDVLLEYITKLVVAWL